MQYSLQVYREISFVSLLIFCCMSYWSGNEKTIAFGCYCYFLDGLLFYNEKYRYVKQQALVSFCNEVPIHHTYLYNMYTSIRGPENFSKGGGEASDMNFKVTGGGSEGYFRNFTMYI